MVQEYWHHLKLAFLGLWHLIRWSFPLQSCFVAVKQWHPVLDRALTKRCLWGWLWELSQTNFNFECFLVVAFWWRTTWITVQWPSSMRSLALDNSISNATGWARTTMLWPTGVVRKNARSSTTTFQIGCWDAFLSIGICWWGHSDLGINHSKLIRIV